MVSGSVGTPRAIRYRRATGGPGRSGATGRSPTWPGSYGPPGCWPPCGTRPWRWRTGRPPRRRSPRAPGCSATTVPSPDGRAPWLPSYRPCPRWTCCRLRPAPTPRSCGRWCCTGCAAVARRVRRWPTRSCGSPGQRPVPGSTCCSPTARRSPRRPGATPSGTCPGPAAARSWPPNRTTTTRTGGKSPTAHCSRRADGRAPHPAQGPRRHANRYPGGNRRDLANRLPQGTRRYTASHDSCHSRPRRPSTPTGKPNPAQDLDDTATDPRHTPTTRHPTTPTHSDPDSDPDDSDDMASAPPKEPLA